MRENKSHEFPLISFLNCEIVIGQSPKFLSPEIKVFTVTPSPTPKNDDDFGSFTSFNKRNETPPILVENTDGNRTIIAGTDIEGLKLHCTADYPIHWTYEGIADFNFVSTSSGRSSRSRDGVEVNEFYETVFLDPLSEVYSAKYVCYGQEFHNRRSSVYIYVPGKNLFVSLRGRNIYFTGDASKSEVINIPCAVSHPNVSVTLSKLNENSSEMRRINNAEFDPKHGFMLRPNTGKPAGKYVCTAQSGKTRRRVVQHTVVRDEGAQSRRCTKGCPENAHCVVGRRGFESSYCTCDESFQALDFDRRYLLCLRKCKTNADCPSNMACQPRDSDADSYFWKSVASEREKREFTTICRNPCIYSQRGGQCDNSSVCKVENQVAKCN